MSNQCILRQDARLALHAIGAGAAAGNETLQAVLQEPRVGARELIGQHRRRFHSHGCAHSRCGQDGGARVADEHDTPAAPLLEFQVVDVIVPDSLRAGYSSEHSRRDAAQILEAGANPAPDQRAGATPAGMWLIRESVAVGWRFTTPSGALVATSAVRAGGEVEVGLTSSATAGWAVTNGAPGLFITDLQTQLLGASCQAGVSVLQALIEKSSLPGQQLTVHRSGRFGLTALHTDGCVLWITGASDNPFAPTGAKPCGVYLWRCGVLLAASAPARAELA
jgi:hypothetical protein